MAKNKREAINLMERVYFLRNREKLFLTCRNLFERIYIADKPLWIKIGFGNLGNKFALSPNDIEPIIKAAKSLGLKPILADTPVTPISYHRFFQKTALGYKKIIFEIFNGFSFLVFSKFFSKRKYEKLIKKRGFPKLAPSVVLNHFGKKILAKDIDVEICREFTEAENVLVISHAKGHSCCGFSGAIKNLAMGMVSIETKKDQHFFAQPKIIKKCQGCGRCIELCPSRAISISGNKLKIDFKNCWGCSICQLECFYKCLTPRKAIFDDLLAQTADTVFKNLPKRTLFVNFAVNISKKCDCLPTTELISDDVGIFFAENPALIDKASIDSINKSNGRDLFSEKNHKNPYLQINFALKYGKISGDYNLINL